MPFSTFIIIWIAWACFLLSFVVYPIFQNRVMKAAAYRFGNQLRQDPALGEEFAHTLNKPVARMDVDAGWDAKTLTTRFSRLPSQVGNFLIHHSQQVGEAGYLIITTVRYYQTIARHPNHTVKNVVTSVTYNLNFVVQFEAPKKQVVILSDLYTTLTDKNLRDDFAKAFLTLLAE